MGSATTRHHGGRVAPDQHLWLDISGKLVGTKALVGPVEVWEGVQGGLDWSAAPK